MTQEGLARKTDIPYNTQNPTLETFTKITGGLEITLDELINTKPNLDKAALGGLIDLVGDIVIGTEEAKSKDILGHVYEYFLGEFANAEGKKGGQYFKGLPVHCLATRSAFLQHADSGVSLVHLKKACWKW